jgi:hypothetical protein
MIMKAIDINGWTLEKENEVLVWFKNNFGQPSFYRWYLDHDLEHMFIVMTDDIYDRYLGSWGQ